MLSASSLTFGQAGSSSLSYSALDEPKKHIQSQLAYAEQIFEDSISKALQIIEENLTLAIQNDYKEEQALAYTTLGNFNSLLNNDALAITNYKKSAGIYQSLNQKTKVYPLYLKIAHSAEKANQLGTSEVYFEKALLLAAQQKKERDEIIILVNLGEVLLLRDQTKKAYSYVQSALNKSQQKEQVDLEIRSKITLGKIKKAQGETDEAKTLFTDAQLLAEKNQLQELANLAYTQLSDLYLFENDLTNNIAVQQQAIEFNQTNGNSNFVLTNTTNLSQTYLEQGKSSEALKLLNENYELLEEEQNPITKIDFIKTLSDAYNQEGLEDLAANEANKYQALLDSFTANKIAKEQQLAQKNEFLASTENKMLLMEKDRELNEKMIQVLQKEQELNNDTIKRQRLITIGLIIGIGIIAILAFLLFRNSKQKQKANQLLVLKSLRSQMNPHFIFNSLNSVNSFISKQDEKSANKYLAEFSKLMREVLECSEQDFISLSKEIEILKRYLNLEHFRFNSHFDYSFEVDPGIKAEEYQIPPMLLQPFIENAIWHGLRYKEAKGQLTVSFVQKDDSIEVTIADNGIGREQSKKMKTLNQQKMKSTGISNAQNRLEIINEVFRKNLEINIRDLDEKTKEGTIVTLNLY